MADLFEITLADGIPVAGDGDVKTINSLMEDGALATVGNRTDPAVATFDATPASVVALLKQVSKILQDLRGDWPASLGSGGGLKVESSNSPITVQGAVDITYESGAVSAAAFTCGTTAYAANDIVGVGGSTGVLMFQSIATIAPGVLVIDSVAVEFYRSAVISGEVGYRLYLYNASPPSALNDSVPIDIQAGDRTSFIGCVDIPAVEAIGGTVHAEINDVNKIVKTITTNIYGYLVTKGAYTPTAVGVRVTVGARSI